MTEEFDPCANLKPMAKWLEEESPKVCRACLLTLPIAWYHNELTEQGLPDLSAELEDSQKSGDPVKVAEILDSIKGKVSPELRQRLLDFDCAAQTYNPDEETSTGAPSASPPASPPQSHTEGSESEAR